MAVVSTDELPAAVLPDAHPRDDEVSVRRDLDFAVRPLAGFHDAGACPGVHDRAFLALLLLRGFGPLGLAELGVGFRLHAFLELREPLDVLLGFDADLHGRATGIGARIRLRLSEKIAEVDVHVLGVIPGVHDLADGRQILRPDDVLVAVAQVRGVASRDVHLDRAVVLKLTHVQQPRGTVILRVGEGLERLPVLDVPDAIEPPAPAQEGDVLRYRQENLMDRANLGRIRSCASLRKG